MKLSVSDKYGIELSEVYAGITIMAAKENLSLCERDGRVELSGTGKSLPDLLDRIRVLESLEETASAVCSQVTKLKLRNIELGKDVQLLQFQVETMNEGNWIETVKYAKVLEESVKVNKAFHVCDIKNTKQEGRIENLQRLITAMWDDQDKLNRVDSIAVRNIALDYKRTNLK